MSTATYEYSHPHGKESAFRRAARNVLAFLWKGYMEAQTRRAESYIRLYSPKSLIK